MQSEHQAARGATAKGVMPDECLAAARRGGRGTANRGVEIRKELKEEKKKKIDAR